MKKLICALIILIFGLPISYGAENSGITELREKDIISASIKITYLGAQFKPVFTLILSTDPSQQNAAVFQGRNKQIYNNDLADNIKQALISKKEFIGAFKQTEPILDSTFATTVLPPPVFSVDVLVQKAGNQTDSEYKLSTKNQVDKFYAALGQAIQDNAEAKRLVAGQLASTPMQAN